MFLCQSTTIIVKKPSNCFIRLKSVRTICSGTHVVRSQLSLSSLFYMLQIGKIEHLLIGLSLTFHSYVAIIYLVGIRGSLVHLLMVSFSNFRFNSYIFIHQIFPHNDFISCKLILQISQRTNQNFSQILYITENNGVVGTN